MTALSRIGTWWARSIRWKLVGVFVAICVLPMLIVTEVATQVVATTFQNNVEAWLFQTSRFFVANILDERRETAHVADALAANGVLDPLLSGRTHEVPPPVARMLDALGYDLLVIYDENNNIFFSSKPLDSVTGLPFADGQTIYLYRQDGKPTLMAAGTHHVVYEGRSFRVLLGTLVDQSFISDMSAIAALAIRLHYRFNDDLVQVYSSQGDVAPVPPAVLAAMEAGEGDAGYVSGDDNDNDQSIGIYTPLRANGKLIGVLYCGLSSDASFADWLTRRNLFIIIFAFGMLLSVSAGLIMSRLLTRPVIRLAEGVNAIAKGDFTQRVPVLRQDEIGQLAMAFNSMARRLEGLRKMEAKLRRRERMTTLGEVAAGLAHEVRNPLGIIKTSAELIARSPNLTEVEGRRLGYVADEVRRIDQLIRDFLAFARPPQASALIAPAALIERVLGICQSEIERQDVQVRIEDECGAALIHIDLDQMIQACLNLVLNALQAMEETKVPAGSLLQLTRPRLDIHLTADEEEVHLLFADNGPGIPPALIDRIFDPFVTSKDTGTGLGLARVFAVAAGHGGWVEARNAVQGGAVFELVIPLADRRAGDVPHDPDR